jgi:hypothetical protein
MQDRIEEDMRSLTTSFCLCAILAALPCVISTTLTAQPAPHIAARLSGVLFQAPPAVDPNKAPSEFNHHMAGWALIGVGLLVIAGLRFGQVRVLRYLWPALFLAAGLFLALWSDAEIWPRGNMNWAWLVHHDLEARQHKVYALLLIAIAVIEYLRARDLLTRFWRVWSFPILALIGAGLLLVHDHAQGSGVNSPEAHSYLVNPALDPDGNPVKSPALADSMPGMNHSGMAMDHSAMTHPGSDSMDMDSMNMDSAEMDQSAVAHAHAEASPSANGSAQPAHHHHMSPSMLLVEREHFWFMVVGLGIALFKLISDADIWKRRFVPYIWPSGMLLLGVLLLFYRE